MAQIFFNGLHIIDGTAAEAFTRFRIQDEVISGTLISAGTVYTLTAEEGAFSTVLNGAPIGIVTPDLYPEDIKAQTGSIRFKEVEGNKWQTGTTRFAGNINMLVPLVFILPAEAGAFTLASDGAAIGKLSGPETRNKFITATGSLDPGEEGTSFLTAEFSAWEPELTVEAVIFTMPAETGAFVLSGTDTVLTRHAVVQANTGAFVLTGQDLGFLHHRVLKAEVGAFTSTFQDAALVNEIIFPITAETGVFTATFAPATLSVTRHMPAQTGSFALTGSDATLAAHRVIPAEQGTFTASFAPVTLAVGRYMSAQEATFALTGSDASVKASRLITAEQGAFTVTFADVALSKEYKLVAGTGVFALTGADVILTKDYIITAESMSLILTGGPAILTNTIAKLPRISSKVTVISLTQRPQVAA